MQVDEGPDRNAVGAGLARVLQHPTGDQEQQQLHGDVRT
jgi:hypothetical protein